MILCGFRDGNEWLTYFASGMPSPHVHLYNECFVGKSPDTPLLVNRVNICTLVSCRCCINKVMCIWLAE